jgi:tetratricopeptide (TPR) repeat protein
MSFVGIAALRLGSDEHAIEWLRRAVETNRNYPIAYFYLAAAFAQLGRLDEARSAVQAGLALNPSFTIRRFRSSARSDNPTVRAQGRRLVEGMRKAGVPER